jgi:exodeoxyribonuclease-3
MKLITWNINSIRIRLDLIKKLTIEHNPDIIALQEIKVENHLFPVNELMNMGYKYIYYSGQKSYHGVAILSKIEANSYFSLELYNDEKRHIAIKIGDVEIHNFYIPSGGDVPDININAKFKHKLEYIKLIEDWFTTNRSINDQLILMGDFNISPFEHDVWSSKQLRNEISHTDIERELLIKFQNSLNFIDSCRHFVPYDQKFYSWWSYRNKDWRKSNRGRRLDHVWVSNNLKNNMKEIFNISDARSWNKPSDHIPYGMILNSKNFNK